MGSFGSTCDVGAEDPLQSGVGPYLAGLPEAAAVALFTASALFSSYALAARLIPGANRSARMVGAFVVLVWLLAATFLALSAVRMFTPGVAMVVWVAMAWAVVRQPANARLTVLSARQDLAALSEWSRRLPVAARLLVGLGTAVAAVRLVHCLLA